MDLLKVIRETLNPNKFAQLILAANKDDLLKVEILGRMIMEEQMAFVSDFVLEAPIPQTEARAKAKKLITKLFPDKDVKRSVTLVFHDDEFEVMTPKEDLSISKLRVMLEFLVRAMSAVDRESRLAWMLGFLGEVSHRIRVAMMDYFQYEEDEAAEVWVSTDVFLYKYISLVNDLMVLRQRYWSKDLRIWADSLASKLTRREYKPADGDHNHAEYIRQLPFWA
jgi:hypothetical protein